MNGDTDAAKVFYLTGPQVPDGTPLADLCPLVGSPWLGKISIILREVLAKENKQPSVIQFLHRCLLGQHPSNSLKGKVGNPDHYNSL